jgi:hypothetical protein
VLTWSVYRDYPDIEATTAEKRCCSGKAAAGWPKLPLIEDLMAGAGTTGHAGPLKGSGGGKQRPAAQEKARECRKWSEMLSEGRKSMKPGSDELLSASSYSGTTSNYNNSSKFS